METDCFSSIWQLISYSCFDFSKKGNPLILSPYFTSLKNIFKSLHFMRPWALPKAADQQNTRHGPCVSETPLSKRFTKVFKDNARDRSLSVLHLLNSLSFLSWVECFVSTPIPMQEWKKQILIWTECTNWLNIINDKDQLQIQDKVKGITCP